jgi:hypothetical protein
MACTVVVVVVRVLPRSSTLLRAELSAGLGGRRGRARGAVSRAVGGLWSSCRVGSLVRARGEEPPHPRREPLGVRRARSEGSGVGVSPDQSFDPARVKFLRQAHDPHITSRWQSGRRGGLHAGLQSAAVRQSP